MKSLVVSALLLTGLLVICVECQDKKVGEPIYSLQAAGGGQNAKNFQAGYNAGIGTKVWESKNKGQSLELGVNYGRGFARVDGHTYKSQPHYGFGATYRFGRK